jgi:hypothetical protein
MAKKAASDNGTPVNKSQAIRDYLAGNPAAGTKDVVAGLADKGVKVTPALVYLIKSKAKQAKRRARRERFAESSRGTGTVDPVELFREVRDLGRKVGGIQNLKRLVDLMAE